MLCTPSRRTTSALFFLAYLLLDVLTPGRSIGYLETRQSYRPQLAAEHSLDPLGSDPVSPTRIPDLEHSMIGRRVLLFAAPRMMVSSTGALLPAIGAHLVGPQASALPPTNRAPVQLDDSLGSTALPRAPPHLRFS